jgi:hypothetical protein
MRLNCSDSFVQSVEISSSERFLKRHLIFTQNIGERVKEVDRKGHRLEFGVTFVLSRGHAEGQIALACNQSMYAGRQLAARERL